MNTQKLKILSKNAALPTGAFALVLWLIFGLSWWLLPASFLLGSFISLGTTSPMKTIGPTRHQLALQEAELDRKLRG